MTIRFAPAAAWQTQRGDQGHHEWHSLYLLHGSSARRGLAVDERSVILL